jgi:Hint domain
VIGVDRLAKIGTPSSGTGPFTAITNPNLGLDLIGGFAGTIAGFVAGDTIVVDVAQAATFAAGASGQVLVETLGGATLGTLSFATPQMASLALSEAGTGLVATIACFAAGTRIATPEGLVPVEDLREGDSVTTLDGVGRVVWAGRRAVDCARHPRPDSVWPVRVSAGAFGPGAPARDVYLSPDHAVYVDGVLIPVKRLVNGRSIAQVERASVIYHHIELERHDIVLAEGLPAESYLDTGDRADFGTEAGVIRLHPTFESAPAWLWETEGAAPLVQSGPVLERARGRLGDAASPHKRFA